jgi:hypothetical protein
MAGIPDRDRVLNMLRMQSDTLNTDNSSEKRQYEVNEWSANNKLDTLFFYQILLISLTLTAPLLYLNKNGLISSTVFYGVTGLLAIAVILTLIVRYQYTVGSRDLRYWNRRRFATMGGPPTAITCESLMPRPAVPEEEFSNYSYDNEQIKQYTS